MAALPTARNLFRSLLRARGTAFQGDAAALLKARTEIRKHFDVRARALRNSPIKVPQNFLHPHLSFPPHPTRAGRLPRPSFRTSRAPPTPTAPTITLRNRRTDRHNTRAGVGSPRRGRHAEEDRGGGGGGVLHPAARGAGARQGSARARGGGREAKGRHT